VTVSAVGPALALRPGSATCARTGGAKGPIKRTARQQRREREDIVCESGAVKAFRCPREEKECDKSVTFRFWDKTTLRDFLKKIEKQYGKAERIWIMDRGIPTEEVLEEMRANDPGKLWEYYLQLTEIEQSFKELKGDLGIRPIQSAK